MNNIFEIATRQKFRFASAKGLLTVEDLWDLPLTSPVGKASLDDIARELFGQLKSNDTVSFVTPSQKSNATVQAQFDVVKYIIDVRVAERDIAETARANKERKQLLLGIIAQKENEQLLGSSLEDLKRMVDNI